ncbi:SDR family oxidoreductase [Microbacterium trichothecenolyticum]|uniref:SDR family NAD(P)-dependent oxidoreductase n=1 Tax=Microbacterium trichothecenolyticum TaxID=69370 RepID=UPI001C6E8CF4|nr:SDR family oxidoreductase [Microbacterium trichothecenolyticum]MBW9122219.1 SDR family oxidoreductase [Microbacterium trichothecenolyticum]
MTVSGRLVIIAGATSASGLTAARVLRDAGARVVAVGRDAGKLRDLVDSLDADAERLGTAPSGSVRTEVCDLGDEDAVASLAERVHEADGPVDGVLHLVGGWRGGGGLAGQTDADYRFLEGSLTALRHVSRAFDADLRASEAGRLAVVSSTAVTRPVAAGANYAAVKAATEAWTRAVAQGFAKDARDADKPLAAASVIFRLKSLDGLEEALAQRFSDLWLTDAADVNDTIVELTDPSL